MPPDVATLLLVVAAGALAAPAFARWSGIPGAVVEIVFGIAVAQLGLAGAVTQPFMRFLADLGFALFLFLAGMEVDAEALRRAGARGLVGPLLIAVGAMLLALGAVRAMGQSAWVGLALGATSVPLLLSVVREAGMSRAPAGREMLLLAAVGEVVTVMFVAFAEVLHAAEGWLQGALGLARLFGMLALVVLGTRVLAVLRWWYPERAQVLMAGDPSESGVRAGFGIAFAMVAVASLAGVEPLLGAFVGGLMVTFAVDEKREIEGKLGAMAYGFFVPVFFVDVGMRLDLGLAEVLANGPRILTFVGLLLLVKLLPVLPLALFGRPLRRTAATALLLAAPLTLVIAIADLAGRLGAIDEATSASLVAAAMAASLVYPSIARRLLNVSPGS